MKASVLIFIFTAVVFHTLAQDTASVYWELSVNTTSTCLTSGGVNAGEQCVAENYIVRDYGGVETSQRVYAAGGGLGYWPSETSENMERFCEFEVFPRNGINFKPLLLELRLGNSGGSSNVKASIYYSTDNFETFTCLDSNIAVPNSALNGYSYNLSDSNINLSDGNSMAVRIYPWLQGGATSGKYFNLRDVKIKGSTTGEVIPELPVVETLEVYKISTQTARFKGLVSNDGGVALDSVGLELKQLIGQDSLVQMIKTDPGVGAFEINLVNLIPGQNYLARTFAANGAGAVFGSFIAFKTLDSLSVPGISSDRISDLKPNGAIAHGTVFFDGGLDVNLNGFCLSTQVSPTLTDIVIEADQGLGAFSAYLPELESQTTYYVRAFAQNEKGYSFGESLSFTTPAPEPDINIVVDLSGNGNYTSIQDAFNNIPFNYPGKINIWVKKGIYHEKVLLEKGKVNVHLLGENRDSTIIRWNDYSGKVVDGVTLGTSTSYTIAIDADDFIAQNITFQNTATEAQAVALRVKGDRMIFYHCNLLGFQDTYYTWGIGRIYHEDCYIEGTVDFIFGSSIAVFKNCEIKSLRNSPITAASTPEYYKFGYVFMDCRLSSSVSGNYLGRPWKPFAQTVFIHTEESSHLASAGWLEWSGTTNHLTCYYAEYNCSGEGYRPDNRVSWSHQLSNSEAEAYTIENIFSKKSAYPAYYYDWVPQFDPYSSVFGQKVGNTKSVACYPNPCSNWVMLYFKVDKTTQVDLQFYNQEGKVILEKQNQRISPENNSIRINTAAFKPGLYFCKAVLNSSQVLQQKFIKN